MVLGTMACVLGVILCIRTARTRFDQSENSEVNLGIARVPAVAFSRLLAFASLILLPAGAVFLANYHTFEGVHEVRGCARAATSCCRWSTICRTRRAARLRRAITRTDGSPRTSATTAIATTVLAETSKQR